MTAPGRDDHDNPPDELVEETRRVASAVQDWLRHTADRAGAQADEWAAGAAGRTGSTAQGPAEHAGCEFEWCPICQFATALRADHPELAARIGEAATALTGALRAIVDTALAHTGDPRPAPAPKRRPSPHPRPAADRPSEPEA